MGEATRRWARPLGIVIAAVIVAGAFLAGRWSRDDRSAPTPLTPKGEAAIVPPPGGSAGVTASTRTPPAADRTKVSFSATARSVELTPSRPLPATGVTIDGADRVELDFLAGITAADGTPIVSNDLVASGGTITLSGPISIDGPLRVLPDGVGLAGARLRVDSGASLVVSAPVLEPGGGGTVTVRTGGTAPVVVGDGARWTGAVPTSAVAAASVSWAGGGQLHAGETTFTDDHLGAVGAFTVDATPNGTGVALSGRGQATQLYGEGQPLLATVATVDLIRTSITVPAGTPNRNAYLTWAPRNKGSVDMTMTSIRADEGPGSWINLRLQTLPPMFGGEALTPVGGDTSGLGDRGRGALFGSGSADPIRAVLPGHSADKRDLSVDVPKDTAPGEYRIVVLLQGNFDPVRLDITITVTPPTSS